MVLKRLSNQHVRWMELAEDRDQVSLTVYFLGVPLSEIKLFKFYLITQPILTCV
jgi:hypothetical protein